jgi:hypothetical protein
VARPTADTVSPHATWSLWWSHTQGPTRRSSRLRTDSNTSASALRLFGYTAVGKPASDDLEGDTPRTSSVSLFVTSTLGQYRGTLSRVRRFAVRHRHDYDGNAAPPLESDEATGTQHFVVGMGNHDNGARPRRNPPRRRRPCRGPFRRKGAVRGSECGGGIAAWCHGRCVRLERELLPQRRPSETPSSILSTDPCWAAADLPDLRAARRPGAATPVEPSPNTACVAFV